MMLQVLAAKKDLQGLSVATPPSYLLTAAALHCITRYLYHSSTVFLSFSIRPTG
jgi:hypothetical protein